jgi:hypothetical protein
MRRRSLYQSVIVAMVCGCSGTDPDDVGTFQARFTGAASLAFAGQAASTSGTLHLRRADETALEP